MKSRLPLTRTAMVLGILVIASLLPEGCLFDTRTPEPPIASGQCPLPVTSTPDSVLVGLSVAMGCRSTSGTPTGRQSYEGLLTDDFSFVPDPIDSSDFVSIDPSAVRFVDNWTKSVESSVFNVYTIESKRLSLVFPESTIVAESADSIRADYVLKRYTASDTVGVTDSTVYTGRALLTVVPVAGGYRISRWEDQRSTGTSWGWLRLTTRKSLGS